MKSNKRIFCLFIAALCLAGCGKPLDITPNYSIENQEQYMALWPNQTGELVMHFEPVGGVAIAPEYSASADSPVFRIEDASHWKAVSSGTGIVWFDFSYSPESMSRLNKAYPNGDFYEQAIASGFKVCVGTSVYCAKNTHTDQCIYFTDLNKPEFLNGEEWQPQETVWLNAPSENIHERDETSFQTIYLLTHPDTHDQIFTLNWGERDLLIEQGWHRENDFGFSYSEGKPVYRLYDPQSGLHRYTADEEKSRILQNEGWTLEGEAWKCLDPDPSHEIK